MIKAIVLDLDNCVLLDPTTGQGSEEIKAAAWPVVFSECRPGFIASCLPDVLAELAMGLGDRHDIAKRFCQLLGYPEAELAAEAERRSAHYSQLVQAGLRDFVVPASTYWALALLEARVALYVNTATPEAAAVESLEALGLSEYFRAVLGRPRTKLENLQLVAEAEYLEPSELLFVDDQPSGWELSKLFGCQFAGIRSARMTAWHGPDPLPFPVIRELGELSQFLPR